MRSVLRCQVFELVTCPVCKQIHHVNPTGGGNLREHAKCEASRHWHGLEADSDRAICRRS